jgi:hypothetical protein
MQANRPYSEKRRLIYREIIYIGNAIYIIGQRITIIYHKHTCNLQG